MKAISLSPNKPSILQNIILNENINHNLLNQLIKSPFLQLQKSNKPGHETYQNEKHHLEEIQKHIKKNKLSVKYKKASYNFGRVFPQKALSIGCLRRPIRHTLCYGNYTDIDVENCHPQLLKQICEANNLNCQYLKQYVDNRAEILAETQAFYNVSRDEAKTLFIRLAYFGSFDNWVKELQLIEQRPTIFIVNYIAELKTIGQYICNANKDLLKAIGNKQNERSSVVSIFLQDIERQILELVYEYLTNNKYISNSNCVLC
jgi:hypothetical protein